jgi:hypothetical protein
LIVKSPVAVTVYVPESEITTSSLDVGTCAGDQLADVFQLPPAALFQEIVAARASMA